MLHRVRNLPAYRSAGTDPRGCACPGVGRRAHPFWERSQMQEEEESRPVLASNPRRRPAPPPDPPPAEGTQPRAGGASDSELQRIYDTHAVQIYRFIYHKV